MSEVNITSEVPTGEAVEIGKLVQRHPERHRVLLLGVRNHVLMVNPHVTMPFEIKEGMPTNLGLFAVDESISRHMLDKAPGEGKRILEAWQGHGRTAILQRVGFRDSAGRFYRDIDLKGIGFLEFDDRNGGSGSVGVSRPGQRGPRWIDSDKPWGLLSYKNANAEYRISEDFLRLGIRTYRVLAIIGLEEIITGGSKMSVEEAIERKLFDERFKPVIAVRAFGTRARVSDIETSGIKEDERVVLIEDAKKMVQEELKGGELSNEDYLKWFARTLGHNLRLMHEGGWTYGLKNSHNVTLDCRFVDVIGARKVRGRSLTREIAENIRDAKVLVYGLANRLGIDKDISLIDMDNALSVREFIDAYDQPVLVEKAV